MADFIHKQICIRLLLVDNNIYSFFGGILISLATNILTTVCFLEFSFVNQWPSYLATILFAIASAICVFIATRITDFQKYMKDKKIKELNERRSIIEDITSRHHKMWIATFAFLFITFVAGIVFLCISNSLLTTINN